MWRLGPIGAFTLVAAAALATLRPHAPPAPALPPATPAPVAVVPPPAHEPLVEAMPRFVFRPRSLEPLRRAPHHTRRHHMATPGGPMRFNTAQHAREGRCAEAMGVGYRAVEISVDHANLFETAWSCFDETHQRPLQNRQALSLRAFEVMQRHFRGDPPPDVAPEVPEWMHEPTGGLEYRLQAFMGASEQSEILRMVMYDLRGEAQVADTVAEDILLILEAAKALARAPVPGERVQAMWAHHVYWATRVLDNHVVSALLRRHRKRDVALFEELYEEATTPPEGGTLPPAVQLAMQLGQSP